MAAKKSKSSVDYSKGMTSSHCGICTHYIKGSHGLQGMCELVAGNIDPAYWCKLFERKQAVDDQPK
jgi:hypothetical protein